MTRDEALCALSSTTARDRLRAARFFAGNADRSDLDVLRNAFRREAVSYVRTSLHLAIKRASVTPLATDVVVAEEVEIPLDVRAQIRNEVTAEVTGQLLHEISSPLGLIASAAAREIPEYDLSKTKSLVETLRRVFDAIEQLKIATAVPKPTEFDLVELLAETASDVQVDGQQELSLIGAKPMLVTSDPGLLRMALSNGVRNAVESVSHVGSDEPHQITITWGQTDIDYWVAVLDAGSGIVGPVESAFDVGTTTKKRHSGFGLAIARQAIETLGGVCTLQPATNGGARFEVRWPR